MCTLGIDVHTLWQSPPILSRWAEQARDDLCVLRNLAQHSPVCVEPLRKALWLATCQHLELLAGTIGKCAEIRANHQNTTRVAWCYSVALYGLSAQGVNAAQSQGAYRFFQTPPLIVVDIKLRSPP